MERKHHRRYENLSNDDEVYNLWLLLANTRRSIYQAREKELNSYNITQEQAGVLFVISHIGNEATPAEISRQTHRKSSTISGLISRMEKSGLVRKVKDLDKKNMVRIALTKKGEQAYSQSEERESIHYIMSSLSEEEQRQLALYLGKIQDKALNRLFPLPPKI